MLAGVNLRSYGPLRNLLDWCLTKPHAGPLTLEVRYAIGRQGPLAVCQRSGPRALQRASLHCRCCLRAGVRAHAVNYEHLDIFARFDFRFVLFCDLYVCVCVCVVSVLFYVCC